jgi:hypothetical protein
MPPPKRRRWFSLSLRTLLIGMTVTAAFVPLLFPSDTVLNAFSACLAIAQARSVCKPSGRDSM